MNVRGLSMTDLAISRAQLMEVLRELAARVAAPQTDTSGSRSVLNEYLGRARSSKKLGGFLRLIGIGQLDRPVDARQFLSHAENVIADIYRSTSCAVAISTLDARFIQEVRQPIVCNAAFVEYVADRYLRVDSSAHYEISEFHSKSIADLLLLVIPPPLPVPTHVNKDVVDFVALVRDDLSRRSYPPGYIISTRWREITQRGIRVAGHVMNAQHVAVLGMARWSFDAGMPILQQVDSLKKSREKYIGLYPELLSVGESPLALPETTVAFDGVAYSPNLEQTFGYYHEICAGVGAGAKLGVVAEIGSGYGRLARVLHLTGKAKCLILIDLPESLATCYAFLRVHFPEARVRVIKSEADVDATMTQHYEFIFCPVQQLDSLRLDDVDLLINTYSFGEMQQGAVDYLLGCAHSKLRPKVFFSLNTIFTDKNIHFAESGHLGEGNEIVLNLQPEWWPLHIDLVERPEADRYRNEVSIVLERVSAPTELLVRRYLAKAAVLPKASKNWVMHMFFAALWTREPAVIQEFLSGLREYHVNVGFAHWASYDFENIGEVQFLRRRLLALTEQA